jgi:hypothetical protein
MRLADQLVHKGCMDLMLESGFGNYGTPKTLALMMTKSTRIIADNATEYLFAESDQDVWRTEDFPNLAPPMELFWMETAKPTAIRTLKDILETNSLPPAWGVQFMGIPAGIDCLYAMNVPGQPKYELDRICKWWLLGMVIVERTGSSPLRIGSFSISVDKDGRAVPLKEWQKCVDWSERQEKSAVYWQYWVSSKLGKEKAEELSLLIKVLADPFLLAISLMHCKNVSLIDDEALSPRQAKAHEKRHKTPLLRYKLLEIEPMKRRLKTEGKSGEVGLKQAMHICRGHFKDYREHGLFGQHKGVYWWESMVRGDIGEGAIVKDYKIKAK